jgi:hypothetical protein
MLCDSGSVHRYQPVCHLPGSKVILAIQRVLPEDREQLRVFNEPPDGVS